MLEMLDLHNSQFSDIEQSYMQIALACAEYGTKQGEVPVGAVIVHDGKIIATGYNQPIVSHDATAHAEMVAIRNACKFFDNYRLPQGCELYVTLEPCTMCLGAIIHARVSKLIFATTEPKAGMIVSQQNFLEKSFYNHYLQVAQGLLADESKAMLQQFFKQRRLAKKQT
ncbi:tRNA adenosine(34) deaminase TadA [Faucicola mancuniensis]|uniref:tRNA adenosine(34) deaminase TadA n=1 Tax=Faucicola mancuniensis TaxID=1309795 RepID=UPI0039779E8F